MEGVKGFTVDIGVVIVVGVDSVGVFGGRKVVGSRARRSWVA
jgi:hypothetical protein